jgi:hypothetical protein
MEALAVKNHKQSTIQRQKHDKKQGVEESPVSIIQSAIDEMEIQMKSLIIEIEKDEDAYKVIAQDKVERKLKSGVSAQLALKHQTTVDVTKQKLEDAIELTNSKIERLQKEKEAFIISIDAKIEKLERTLKLDKSKAEGTLAYFQPLVDRYYEDVPLTISYPPSYFKKKETLKNLQRSIETQKNLILHMKAAQFEDTSKWDKEEERLRKMREQSRREFIQREKEEKEREEFQRQEAIKVIQQQREARERADDARRENHKLMLENLEKDGLLEN